MKHVDTVWINASTQKIKKLSKNLHNCIKDRFPWWNEDHIDAKSLIAAPHPVKNKEVFKDPKEVWFYNSMLGKTIPQLAEKIKPFLCI